DNKVVFAMSRQETSFYEFAQYFKNLNCREALYLDGFVSRMYLPEEKLEQMDGDFAVIIGVTE
ncbi:MAG: phosphodiester glycosidase family protein, partial [Pyrinomonadaceae bacterium]